MEAEPVNPYNHIIVPDVCHSGGNIIGMLSNHQREQDLMGDVPDRVARVIDIPQRDGEVEGSHPKVVLVDEGSINKNRRSPAI